VIELLTMMLAAYEQTAVVPPRIRDGRRPWYILKLNAFGVLTQQQIAVCCHTNRQSVAAVLGRGNIKPSHNVTRGILNPGGLEIMLIAARCWHLGEPVPEDLVRPLLHDCGTPALVARLTGIPYHRFRNAKNIEERSLNHADAQ